MPYYRLSTGNPVVAVFSQAGVLAVGGPYGRRYNNSGVTRFITSVQASVDVAPTGASIILDVRKNGVSIFAAPGDRLTIPAGQTYATAAATANTTWAAGEYLDVVVAQVGSTTPGSYLSGEVITS